MKELLKVARQTQALRITKARRREDRDLAGAIFDTASSLIVVLDREGRIVRFNRAGESLVGYQLEEVQGRYIWDIFLLDRERETVKGVFEHIRGGDVVARHENHWRCKDGSARLFDWSNSVLLDERGEVQYIISIGIDITEHKRKELVIRESKEQFAKVVDRSPLSMALVLGDGTIEYFNQKAIDTFGYLPRDIPNMDRWWEQAYPDETYRTRVKTEWMGLAQDALAQNREIQKREYRVTCRNGRVILAEIWGVWVANKVLVMFEDITERRHQEQLRIEKEKAHRDALIREVHHRIKNNLQSVAGLLQRELGKFLELDPRLETAISQINVIAVVHGLQSSDPNEAIRLSEVVRSICKTVASLAQRPVLFDPAPAATSPAQIEIGADEAVSVALVLNELILNATKHSPQGSAAATVTLSHDDSGVQVVIRNAFTGAAKFDIDAGKGIGTGLSLVRSLLPEQGAELTYAVDPEGLMLTRLRLGFPVVTPTPGKAPV